MERFLTPRIKFEADRIEDILESDQVNSIDRTAAERLRGIIVVSYYFNLLLFLLIFYAKKLFFI